MKKWLRTAIVIGLAVLLISGCTEGDPPTPSNPTTPTDPTTQTTVPPTEPSEVPTETVPERHGWYDIDGKRYYFDDRGEPHIGWLTLPSGTYYLGPDGVAAVGWTNIDERTYFFRENGARHTGWLELEEKRFYLDAEGILVTGWQDLEDGRYYFSEDGSMCVGWLALEEQDYYFLANGTMVTGWQDLEDGRYYFFEDGSMCVGWLTLGEYEYYFLENGTMATGKQILEDRTYYFTPDGVHLVLVNPWNALPEDYQVDLVYSERDLQVSAECYDALQKMFAGCRSAGCDPVLLSTFRSWDTQSYLYRNKVNYYLDLGYEDSTARYLAGRIVAVPGTSEHQLGLAVDIVDNSNWNLNESQEKTETQQWLMEHCWEYGFILRYPSGSTDITGIIYEPWHYRYVGVEVALAIRDSGLTLEEYLGAV